MSENSEKDIKEKQVKRMSKCRIMKNLNITCLGFFFLFCAFQSNATLKTTINRHGSMSQSVTYVAQAISCLLFPKLLITKLGCKYTYLLSIIAHIPFMISNYYGDFLSQLLTSVLLGLGGGTLWSSACTYVNEISNLYSSQSDEPVFFVTSRFFGIFFMIFQNSQIWGNLVPFFILKSIDNGNVNETLLLSRNTSVECGVKFCGLDNRELVSQLTDEKRFILITVYLAFTVLSASVIAMFLDELQRQCSDKDSNILFSKLTATLKHMRKPNQILMIPITIFIGVEQAFILSDYSEGFIACALGIKNISLIFIFYGLVNAVASFLIGWFSKNVPRLLTLLMGAAGNALACNMMLLWIPDHTDNLYFFFVIGLWGMSDAVWQTIIFSMYGILFGKDEEAAFGNLRLWEAVGFFIPYFCNKRLCMSSKLYLMIGMLMAGIIGCCIVEISVLGKSEFSPVKSKNCCNKNNN